jgi:hypothetical protein
VLFVPRFWGYRLLRGAMNHLTGARGWLHWRRKSLPVCTVISSQKYAQCSPGEANAAG